MSDIYEMIKRAKERCRYEIEIFNRLAPLKEPSCNVNANDFLKMVEALEFEIRALKDENQLMKRELDIERHVIINSMIFAD